MQNSNVIVEFTQWVLAVIRSWYGWVSSSAIAAVIGLAQGLGVYQPAPAVYLAVMGGGIAYSLFDAWRQQFREAQALSRPKFKLTIDQAISTLQNEHTLVILRVVLVNQGADSAVIGWGLKYKSSTLECEPTLVLLKDKVITIPVPNSSVPFVMNPKDMIAIRTNQVVPRGAQVVGRLTMLVVGNRVDEVATGDALITVTVEDYLNQKHTCEFRGTGHAPPDSRMVYHIAEPISENVQPYELNPPTAKHKKANVKKRRGK